MNMQTLRHVTSGRWILTISAAAGLLAITVTICIQALQGQLLSVDPAALMAIYTMVFMSYFNRSRTGESDNGNSDVEIATHT